MRTPGHAARLTETLIAAGLPITGLALNVHTVEEYSTTNGVPLTPAQLAQANAIVAAFDWSDSADTAYTDNKEPALKTIRDEAAAAMTAIDTYLATADTATAAQVRVEVKAQAQRQKQIIRALIRLAGS
jgi:hypothetical protein